MTPSIAAPVRRRTTSPSSPGVGKQRARPTLTEDTRPSRLQSHITPFAHQKRRDRGKTRGISWFKPTYKHSQWRISDATTRDARTVAPPKNIKTSSIPHWGVRNPCRDVRGSHFSTLMTADSVEDRPSCRQARERARSRSLGAQTYSVPSGKRPNQPAAEIRASLRSRHSRALFHSRMEVGSWPALAIRFRKKPRITPSTGLDVCTMVVRIPKFFRRSSYHHWR